MSIYKIHKNKNYTIMSNYHLKDEKLSLKAKGLLSLMLSLPDDWDYSVRGLEQICKETKDTINGIINELEEQNYVVRKRIYCNGKISDWEYNIYENNDLHPKNQDIENQDIGFYDINKYTKELNTKELKKENYIKEKIKSKDLPKDVYGEFNNVFLTKEEYEKLKAKNLLHFIDKASYYIESTGKKYKSHYATILNWDKKEKPKENDDGMYIRI